MSGWRRGWRRGSGDQFEDLSEGDGFRKAAPRNVRTTVHRVWNLMSPCSNETAHCSSTPRVTMQVRHRFGSCRSGLTLTVSTTA